MGGFSRTVVAGAGSREWLRMVVLMLAWCGCLAGAMPTASAASPKEIKTSIDAAEKLLAAGQAAAAIAPLSEATAGLEEASRGDRVPSSLRLLAKRCADLRQKLAAAGADVSGIEVPSLVGPARQREAKAEPAGSPAGVSFSREIAPLLVRSCGGCHVGGKKGDFHVPTFAALMQSGMVQRGAGEASRIVEVIATGDMPRGGGKVAAEDLARLVRWIDAGAAYDGGDPALPLASLGRSQPPVRATNLSPEQLTAVRRKAAAEEWRQFLPDEEPRVSERGSLTVIGNLPPARLDATSAVAGSVWQRLGERLAAKPASRDDPAAHLVAGGVVLYAFARPYDFSEFWLARHAAERPRGVTATAGLTDDVVYAAVVASGSDDIDGEEGDLAFAIAEQLGAATFLARGAPAWFAAGAGRTLASDLVPRSSAARSWREKIPAALEETEAAEAFFAGRCAPGPTATVAGGFVDRITGKSNRLPDLLTALADGADFPAVFQKAFRDDPTALYEAWRRQEGSRSRRR
jgi:hypothetical protein